MYSIHLFLTLVFDQEQNALMNFTRGHTILATTKYTTNNSPLQKKNSIRDLGVLIDANVRFDHICRSTRRKLGFLFRNAKQLKKKTRD